MPVDRELALFVAAHDVVAADTDHPLHQVATGRIEPDLGHRLGEEAVGALGVLGPAPPPRVLDDPHDAPPPCPATPLAPLLPTPPLSLGRRPRRTTRRPPVY